MTTLDARGRDRVQGPKEFTYQRYSRLTTWLILPVGLVWAFAWIGWATTDAFDERGRLTALLWIGSATVLGSALVAARLVLGAMRAAAEAAGE